MILDFKSNVEKTLSDLGTTPNQVAETLRRLGIRGERRNTCECPIANFLKETFPNHRFMGVYRYACFYNETAVVPDPVVRMINGFDAGDFDFLLPKRRRWQFWRR